MKIIPAIDIIEGRCVRLSQGNYSSCKVYSSDPLEVAKVFEAAGFTRLHLVDLDGAKSAGVVNLRVLEQICGGTALRVDFGGGIKSDADIKCVFDAGAGFACVGSIAQTNVEKTSGWLEEYGSERVIIGADVWNGKVCINGWKKVTDTSVNSLVESYEGKIRYLMCTDITKDGMLGGTAIGLYKELGVKFPDLKLIASGGVSGYDDLLQLTEAGVEAVVVGKAIYEKRVGLEELIRLERDSEGRL